MKNFIVRLGMFTGIAAIGYGVYNYYRKQINLALQYCYKIYDIDIITIEQNLIVFKIFIKIKNKSNFSFKLKGYDLNVSLNRNHIANITSSTEQYVYNNAVSTIELLVKFNPRMTFDWDDLIDLIANMIGDRSKIFISIYGRINAGIDFINFKIPVSFELTLEEMLSKGKSAESKKVKCNI